MIVLSVVSHKQGHLIEDLLTDLLRIHPHTAFSLIVTLNLPEDLSWTPSDWPFPVTILKNPRSLGFGANHNQAFKIADEGKDFTTFVVVNPDVRLPEDPFPVLMEQMSAQNCGAIAPAVLSSKGQIENNARRFPTAGSVIKKVLGMGDGRYHYHINDPSFYADWVAGMFVAFRRDVFKSIGGFDDRFFLYYEDVDICTRLWIAGRTVVLCPSAQIVHDAQRASHRRIRYLKWHLASMLRYLTKAEANAARSQQAKRKAERHATSA